MLKNGVGSAIKQRAQNGGGGGGGIGSGRGINSEGEREFHWSPGQPPTFGPHWYVCVLLSPCLETGHVVVRPIESHADLW